jgi:protocatechuate 3,4-dioxygenase beta subunit
MRRLRVTASLLAAVLAGTAAATTGASPAFAQGGTGTLAGTVRDTQGAAVRDATIVVYPSDPAGVEVATAATDIAGRFAVSAITPGRYQILIARGHWSEWAPGRIDERAEAPAYRVLAGRTTVVHSVVSAPGHIAGRVVTAAGRPASGIRVAVVDQATVAEWDTTTAADGTYSLTLPPGNGYYLSFTNGFLAQFSPRTLDPAQARLYTVRSGRTTRVNERLLAPATVSGRLVDESGTPVAGARVQVDMINTLGTASTSTDMAGRYTISTLPPGPVTVAFTAPDGTTQWAYQKATSADADRFTLALGTVTIVNDSILPYLRPGRIAGRVTTATGQPAPGIGVAVVDRATVAEWDTITAADGTYSVTLPPGNGYYIGFTNGSLTQFSPQALDSAQARLYTVTSGITTVVDEQLLVPATVSGRLVDESGTPVAGARVQVDMINTLGTASTSTDAAGRYTIATLPPGPVTVAFTAPDGRFQWAYQKTTGADADRFTLVLGTVTTVDDTLLPIMAPAR